MQKLYCWGWIYRGYVVLKGSASWLGTRRLRPSARCHTQHNTGRGTLGILIRRAHHCTGDTLTMWHCNNDNGHGGLGTALKVRTRISASRDTHCCVVYIVEAYSGVRGDGKKPSGVIILSNVLQDSKFRIIGFIDSNSSVKKSHTVVQIRGCWWVAFMKNNCEYANWSFWPEFIQ